MLKKRTLALLLSLAMLLTFMPAMAFAEDAADEASDQPAVTDISEEAAVETAEEAVSFDALAEGEERPTSLKFVPAKDFEFDALEGEEVLGIWHLGNSFTVGYSGGRTETYTYVEYSEFDEEDGIEYESEGYCLNGKIEDGQGYFFSEINGSTEGVIKAGENTVRLGFEYGEGEYVYTEPFTVEAAMLPVEVEFVPANGVTLWGFEGDDIIDGNAFYAEGNKFIVTYSDNKTKKTFTCKEFEAEHFVGYFEDGVEIKKDASGDYVTQYFDYDIPGGIVKLGENKVRVGIDAGGDMVWSSETYTVTGKPLAKSVSFTPSTLDAVIFPDHDFIDWFKEGNKLVVTYSDNTSKSFKPAELKANGGGTYYAFVNGDEELYWDYTPERLQEGPNDVTLHVGNLLPYNDEQGNNEITCKIKINAHRDGVCKTHKLFKVKAVKATCQEKGVKQHYECSVCHKLFTDKKGKKETTYEKLLTKTAKHVYKKKIVSDEYLKTAATCTKPAVYYYACKTCDHKGTKTFKSGKKLGHDYVPGSITKAAAKKNGKVASKCSRCGKTDKGVSIKKGSSVFSLNKKSIRYIGEGKEKDAISLRIRADKRFPVVEGVDYTVDRSEPVYGKNGKGSGTVTITFTPECKYYSGTLTLKYTITKVPKVIN